MEKTTEHPEVAASGCSINPQKDVRLVQIWPFNPIIASEVCIYRSPEIFDKL